MARDKKYPDWVEFTIGLYEEQRRGLITSEELTRAIKGETVIAVDLVISRAYTHQSTVRAEAHEKA